MSVVASIHVHRVSGVGVARAFAHMAADRFSFRSLEGLRFVKSLGTGSGETFGVRDADVHRWATFAVWESIEAQQRYRESAVAKRWDALADESWHATLTPFRVRGTWSGTNPFGPLSFVDPDGRAVPQGRVVPDGRAVPQGRVVPDGREVPHGRVAAITRARIRPSQWRAFWRAVPPVAESMNTTPGLLYRVGIGEAPVGLQGTFSVWDSNDAIDQFAYRTVQHRDVIRQTHQTHWYAEEMFARFAIGETEGTLDGKPL